MTEKKSYAELRRELDELVEWFESSEDFDIEQATAKYQRAEQLIAQLQKLLEKTELQITKLAAES